MSGRLKMTQAYNYSHDFKNKRRNITQLNDYMLNKTLSMFEYENLPDSIPYRELEKQLQIGGYTFITEVKGELYALQGGLGGIPDAYGQPTKIIISNPYLNFYEELDIEEDGVLIRNDDLMTGVLPLYERFNTLLVENDINMLLHGYGTRMKTLISASDDGTKESAELYIKKLIDGEPSVIGESALFDGITVHSGGDSSSASSLIEMTQYLKASLYSEVGISTNFNMKKARLIVDEVEQQQDGAFPYVYSMMKNRLVAIKKINEKYGTDIKVDFGSIWNIQNRRFVDDIIEKDLAEELIPSGPVDTTEETDKPVDTTQEPVETDTQETDGPVETQDIQPTTDEIKEPVETTQETDKPVDTTQDDKPVETTEDDIDVDAEITDEDELVAEILSEKLEVDEPVIEEIINAIEELKADDELEEVVIDTPDEEPNIVVSLEDDEPVTEVEKNINNTDTEEKEKKKDDTE